MTSNDLKILPVKIEVEDIDKKWLKMHPILPKKEFILTMVAPPRSGKSNLIVNLLYNPNFNYKKFYDRIIYISPTIQYDKTLKAVRDDPDIELFYKPEDLKDLGALLGAIVEDQMEAKKKGELQTTLLILDDMLGTLRDESLSVLSSQYRHYSLAIILTTQNYKSVSPIVRNCTSYWILFKSTLDKEVAKFVEDMAIIPDFFNLYTICTKEKYGFVFIDMLKLHLYKKFELLLYEPD